MIDFIFSVPVWEVAVGVCIGILLVVTIIPAIIIGITVVWGFLTLLPDIFNYFFK